MWLRTMKLPLHFLYSSMMKEIFHQPQKIRRTTKREILLLPHAAIPAITEELSGFHRGEAQKWHWKTTAGLLESLQRTILEVIIISQFHIRGILYGKYFTPGFLKIQMSSIFLAYYKKFQVYTTVCSSTV